MTDPAAGAPADRSLQFDRAERAGQTPGTACSFCQQPIAGSYYEINGKVSCLGCRGQIMAAWNRGSPALRFAKALGLGAAAAALGAGVYFGVEALTGYEFGLIAVVVGLLVGAAVRRGSSGRGGWRYQVLAMFLTYSAVVATDSTLIAAEGNTGAGGLRRRGALGRHDPGCRQRRSDHRPPAPRAPGPALRRYRAPRARIRSAGHNRFLEPAASAHCGVRVVRGLEAEPRRGAPGDGTLSGCAGRPQLTVPP